MTRAFQFAQDPMLYDWQTGQGMPAHPIKEPVLVRVYGLEPGTGKAWDYIVTRDPNTGDREWTFQGPA